MCALRDSSVGRREHWQRWMADALWEIDPDAPAVSTRESLRATPAPRGSIVWGGEHSVDRRRCCYPSLRCAELPYVNEQKRI